MKTFRWLRAVIVLAIASCGGSTEPDRASTVTGRWLGTVPLGTALMTVTVTLAQTGSSVTGNGAIQNQIESVAITASGTFVAPNLSLTIGAQGFEQMNYSGQLVTDIQIDGTLNGSGFNNRVLNLVRQP